MGTQAHMAPTKRSIALSDLAEVKICAGHSIWTHICNLDYLGHLCKRASTLLRNLPSNSCCRCDQWRGQKARAARNVVVGGALAWCIALAVSRFEQNISGLCFILMVGCAPERNVLSTWIIVYSLHPCVSCGMLATTATQIVIGVWAY